MNKKIKVLIIAVVIVVILAVAAAPLLKWYNQQEYVIVSKAFDITVNKNADIIYFDEDVEYLHAAYGVSEDVYAKLLNKIDDAGYVDVAIETTDITNYEWIPSDRVVTAYGFDESATYIFVTELQNGFIELYFVK